MTFPRTVDLHRFFWRRRLKPRNNVEVYYLRISRYVHIYIYVFCTERWKLLLRQLGLQYPWSNQLHRPVCRKWKADLWRFLRKRHFPWLGRFWCCLWSDVCFVTSVVCCCWKDTWKCVMNAANCRFWQQNNILVYSVVYLWIVCPPRMFGAKCNRVCPPGCKVCHPGTGSCLIVEPSTTTTTLKPVIPTVPPVVIGSSC